MALFTSVGPRLQGPLAAMAKYSTRGSGLQHINRGPLLLRAHRIAHEKPQSQVTRARPISARLVPKIDFRQAKALYWMSPSISRAIRSRPTYLPGCRETECLLVPRDSCLIDCELTRNGLSISTGAGGEDGSKWWEPKRAAKNTAGLSDPYVSQSLTASSSSNAVSPRS